jgi:hypothetical protein
MGEGPIWYAYCINKKSTNSSNMNTKWFNVVLIVAVLLASVNIATHAQRRVVVRKPGKTVVVTRVPRSKVVYVNRREAPRHVVVRTLPSECVTIVHRNRNYYYHGGRYYENRPEGYVVVPPPAGIVITTAPPRMTRVVVRTGIFFYLSGVFYKEAPGGYKTVTPPEGAQVEELPEDAEKVNIDGKIFYDDNGTLYKKVETENGYAYEVSGNVED